MAMELSTLHINLAQERKRLIEELEHLKANGNSKTEQQEASYFRGKEEAADATTGMERRIALDTRKRNSLAGIERVLQKINAGTYGICDNCGHPIDPGRIEALPHAAYCMTCSSTRKK